MWKNLLLIPASLLVAFLVGELLVRIWLPVPSPYPIRPGLLVLDTRGVWVLEPGYAGVMDNRIDFREKQLTVTSLGTRRVPCADRVSGAAGRIFLIGDSQTFGFGLSDEETWANRLQCRLNDGKGPALRVYNLGIFGTNVDQYRAHAENIVAPAVRPGDVVVVGVTWNDLHTYQPPPPAVRAGTAEGGAATVSVDEALRPRLGSPVRRYGAATWRYGLYRHTGIFIPRFGSLSEFVLSMGHVSSLFRVLAAKARLAWYLVRGRSALFDKIRPGTFDNNFAQLAALSRTMRRRGARVIVVLLPNRVFFDEYYYQAYSKGGKVFPEQDFMSYLATPRCARLSLDCVSMFGVLATDVRDRHTFPYDGHYNARGADRIAGALAQLIRERPPVAGGH